MADPRDSYAPLAMIMDTSACIRTYLFILYIGICARVHSYKAIKSIYSATEVLLYSLAE